MRVCWCVGVRQRVDVASLYTKWRTHTTFRPASTLAMRVRCAPQTLLWPSPRLGETLSSFVLNVAWSPGRLGVLLLEVGCRLASIWVRWGSLSIQLLLSLFLLLFRWSFPCSYFLVCPVPTLVVCRLHHRLPLARFWFLFQLHPSTVFLPYPPIVIPFYCNSFSFNFFQVLDVVAVALNKIMFDWIFS